MANHPTDIRSTTPEKRPNVSEPSGTFGQQGGQSLGEKAKELGEKAKETASDVATKAGTVASSAATTVGEKADQGVAAVGTGMRSLAGSIREHAPGSGMISRASAKVAESLESSGRYLQEEKMHGMAEDVTTLIRRNPIPAVLIGIGIGFLLARSTRS
ncbi:hypothetical protein AYO44_17630 [Planctomycetaceae bacterium SCGC AG-212-F19]|nr:hypothetical protein AYO44_17630 [Planctomycetaceae bacterium SCGC AG-212-F19]